MLLETPFKNCWETVVKMSQRHLHSNKSLIANHLTFSVLSDVETCRSYFWTIIQALLETFSSGIFVNVVCVIWTATFYPAGLEKSHKKWVVLLKSTCSSVSPWSYSTWSPISMSSSWQHWSDNGWLHRHSPVRVLGKGSEQISRYNWMCSVFIMLFTTCSIMSGQGNMHVGKYTQFL